MPSIREPLGIPVLNLCCPSKPSKRQELYKWFILFLTFIVYMAYHMSRKPISVVKNYKEFLDCSDNSDSCVSWISKMNGTSEEAAKGDLATLDLAYLISYAVFMFVSGWVAERMDLRYFLSGGMILSGVVTFFFGFAYTAGIHSYGYLIGMQVLNGVFQSTGWPGVVTVVANWFGKGRKGLIMGIWNSHTSIGNVLGNTIAGAFVETNWGLSFMVPGIGITAAGLVMFFLLAPSPEDAGFQPEQDEESAGEEEEEKKAEEKEEKAISLFGALKIPGVVEFSLCLFFSKLVAYTFLYWLPNYIHETSGVDGEQAANLANFFDYGGILGGISCGILNDKTKKPAITCAIMLTMAIPCLLLYQALVSDW
jgi:OPA family glycerol-3-phosphate transporter-like MFS transporter 1/2